MKRVQLRVSSEPLVADAVHDDRALVLVITEQDIEMPSLPAHGVLPRQESFASLHILTRRASEGSEALPSLARRVSMSFFGARVILRLMQHEVGRMGRRDRGPTLSGGGNSQILQSPGEELLKVRWECQKISLGLLGQANFVVHSCSSATMSFNGRTRPADSSSSPLLTLVGSRPGAEMGWPEGSKILPDSSTCTGRVVDLSFLVDRDRITRASGGIVDYGRRKRD